jgi:hypothetical protein
MNVGFHIIFGEHEMSSIVLVIIPRNQFNLWSVVVLALVVVVIVIVVVLVVEMWAYLLLYICALFCKR